jgi:hypothetical protein
MFCYRIILAGFAHLPTQVLKFKQQNYLKMYKRIIDMIVVIGDYAFFFSPQRRGW